LPNNEAPVITFYSYKGGTGRSLAITQMAACLAHYGKKVVLVDLDLDSPSLHHKLAHLKSWTSERKRPKDGVVDMLRSGVQTARELGYVATCNVCKRPGVLAREKTEPFLSLPSDQHTLFSPNNRGGSIAFFSSGLPTDDIVIRAHDHEAMQPIWRYWETLYNRETQTLFSYSPQFEVAFRGLIDDLRNRQTDAPDYILIDASSGNSPLSHVATRLLSDKIVAFTGTQEDSVLGTAMMLSRMIRPDLEIYVAISKVPIEYRDRFHKPLVIGNEAERHLAEDIQDKVMRANPRILPHRFFVLHLDPFIAYREQLPIPLTEQRHTTRTKLVEDYLNLFRQLLRKEDQDSFGKYYKSFLRKDLEEIRLFHLLRDKGLLINPNDESRNVAMRADTLGQLIQTLTNYAGEDSENLLRLAGLQAAEQFINALVNKWNSHAETEGLTALERLEAWCEFDSTVGFGRFSLETGSSERKGAIILCENFLLYNKQPEDASLCSFWVGYLTTVVRVITSDDSLSVVHPETECGQYHRELGPYCKFVYKPDDASSAANETLEVR